MLMSMSFFVDLQGLKHKRLYLAEIPHRVVKVCQIIYTVRDFGMIFSRMFPQYFQCPLVNRLGLGKVALFLIQFSEIDKRGGDLWMVLAQLFLADF